MYGCLPDPERDNTSFLITDPNVSCEASTSRLVIHIHSFLALALVEVGFPLLSFLKIRMLKNNGQLDAHSSAASLYQFYNTSWPYFESVQFLRKAALIFAVTLSRNPLKESLLSSTVNAAYILLIYWSRPFVYFPSLFFGHQNLF